MRNHKICIWMLLALLFCANGASAQKMSVEKVIDKASLDAGTPVVISLWITNPFDSQVNVTIVDKNVFADIHIEPRPQEFNIPPGPNNPLEYPPITPSIGGNYTLDSATLTYTNPDTGQEETVSSNTVNISVKDTQQNEQQQQNQQQQNQQQQNQEQQQKQQSAVQNNQMDQNANAIKQEIAKEQEEKKQMEDAFQKTLENNTDFQKQDQSLQQQGYKPTGSKNEPVSNDSGKFQKNYKKESGENASLQGEMKNGSIRNMQAQTSEDVKKALTALQADPSYQQYDKQLAGQGFNASGAQVQQTGPNSSKITVPYSNGSIEKNITAEYVDGSIKNVKIEEKKENQHDVMWLAAAFVALALFAYVLYGKYWKKKAVIQECAPCAPAFIDYRTEAKNMLSEAEDLFSNSREKDAYEKVSQGVRFYFSFDLGERKDLSNMELLDLLKKKRNDKYPQAQKCLSLCGLVEFAKYKANKEDFSEIIAIAKQIIS